MANIQDKLNNIKNALFGKDVRSSIHDGIDAINKEVESTTERQNKLGEQFKNLVINEGNSNAEVAASRGSHDWLPDRLDNFDSQLKQIDDKSSQALAKAENPVGAILQSGYKFGLSVFDEEAIQAISGNTSITLADGYLDNNRGVEYPLRNVVYKGEIGVVTQDVKNAILDAKIYGARSGMYYRLTFIGNGYVSNGKARWGVTLEERPISTFATSESTYRFIFIYNNDEKFGNSANANWEKVSDNIETLIVSDGEITLNLTIDRSKISGEYLNLNIDAKSTIIDPSNYFFL